MISGDECHGLTKFSDWSDDEFQTILGLTIPADIQQQNFTNTRNTENLFEKADTQIETVSYSNTVDWTGIYTTAIKDQGSCGCCWAFSATEQIESDAIRTLGLSPHIPLSTQEICTCTTTSYGCGGGWIPNGISYGIANGMAYDIDYPYISGVSSCSNKQCTGTCSMKDNLRRISVNSYSMINGEMNMAVYVATVGPLAIGICADSFQTYVGGILSVCCSGVNHAVQLVGINWSQKYWIVSHHTK